MRYLWKTFILGNACAGFLSAANFYLGTYWTYFGIVSLLLPYKVFSPVRSILVWFGLGVVEGCVIFSGLFLFYLTIVRFAETFNPYRTLPVWWCSMILLYPLAGLAHMFKTDVSPPFKAVYSHREQIVFFALHLVSLLGGVALTYAIAARLRQRNRESALWLGTVFLLFEYASALFWLYPMTRFL